MRRTYQEVIDTLLFISDEMEMQWLPTREGASALRLAAGSVRVDHRVDLKRLKLGFRQRSRKYVMPEAAPIRTSARPESAGADQLKSR